MKNIKKIIVFVFLFAFLSTGSFALAIVKTVPKQSPIHQKTKIVKPENLDSARGIITAITKDSITISIEQKGKKKMAETKIIPLVSSTEVRKDLTKIALNDLKVGDNIQVNLELIKGTYYARNIRVMIDKTQDLIKKLRALKNK